MMPRTPAVHIRQQGGNPANPQGQAHAGHRARQLLFSIQEWQASRPRILQRIRDQFQGAKLAVRSSALIEDGANESMAGAFLSLQHVNGASPGDVTDAITRVMQSMTGNPRTKCSCSR